MINANILIRCDSIIFLSTHIYVSFPSSLYYKKNRIFLLYPILDVKIKYRYRNTSSSHLFDGPLIIILFQLGMPSRKRRTLNLQRMLVSIAWRQNTIP